MYDPGFYHSNCMCNELHAIKYRVFIADTPACKLPGELELAMRQVTRPLRHTHVDQWSYESVCDTYDGPKRERYRAAMESLKVSGLDSRDGRVSAFVKADKCQTKRGDPRMIQFRSFRFCLVLASYLKPMEHRIYALKTPRSGGVKPSRIIGKGLNSKQIARLIEKKWNCFRDCVVVGIDAKRFDACVSVDVLKIEHDVYKRMNNSSELKWLLKQQLHNKCRTSWGITYATHGRRMSGDCNTGLGNTIISCAMVQALCTRAKLSRFDYLVDGDDVLVFAERSDLDRVLAIIPYANNFGFRMGEPDIAYVKEEIIFGRSTYAKLSVGPMMVRNHLRAVVTSYMGYRFYNTVTGGRRYAKTIAVCGSHITRRQPLLHAIHVRMCELLEKERVYTNMSDLDYSMRRELKYVPREGVVDMPLEEDYRAMEVGWGLSADAIKSLESELVSSISIGDPCLKVCEPPLFDDGPQ